MSIPPLRPGQSFEFTFDLGQTGLTPGVQIIDGAGNVSSARATTGIVEQGSTGIYTATRIAPSTAGQFIAVADNGTQSPGNYVSEDFLVSYSAAPVPGPGFATSADVSERLGRTLTATEIAQAEGVIATVTGLILDEVDQDQAWGAALSPVPPALKGLCVSKAIIALSNPNGVATTSETLGQHTYSQTFPRSLDGMSIFLSPQEGRLARQAVYGTLTGSSTPRATEDRFIDLREGQDVDEGLVNEPV